MTNNFNNLTFDTYKVAKNTFDSLHTVESLKIESQHITAPTKKAGFSFRFDNLFFIFIFYFYDLNLRATALRVAAKRYKK